MKSILRLALLLAAPAAQWTPRSLPMTLATGESATRKPLPATMPGGFAIFDFDNDGLLDIFLTNGGDLPAGRKTRPEHSNRLFRNLGGMRFEDVTARAGLAGSGYSFGVSAADYDGDGFTDLLVTGLHGVTLYRNRGNGAFTDVTASAGLSKTGGRWAVAAAFFDKDNDGDLDLFIVNYVGWNPSSERECLVEGKPDFCHPRYYPATANALFENRGDGTFLDVSVATGIAAHPGKGMSVAVADFNGDGYADLFVTNDRVFNSLFLGNGKTFEEAAFAWGLAAPADGNPASAMGVDAQDFDRDGKPDLIYSALRDETFPLYRNTGSNFADVTASSRMAILTRPMAGWGILFADLDNDGWPDIIAARSDALSATGGHAASAKEPPSWFRNLGNGQFAPGVGWEQIAPAMTRGILAADLDNDGCLDVVLTALQASPRIMRNPCGQTNWLSVDVRQPGARVRVDSQWRIVSSATGYASSYAGPQHFGLGTSRLVKEVEVIWPDGKKKLVKDVAANRRLRIDP